MLSAIFKGLYRGHGIYWHGAAGYGDEANAIGTLADCHAAIDRLEAQQEQRERERFNGAELKGYRHGDTARIEYNGAIVFTGSMWEARRQVFALEDRYDADIVWE